jgi:hypothetical protein
MAIEFRGFERRWFAAGCVTLKMRTTLQSNVETALVFGKAIGQDLQD